MHVKHALLPSELIAHWDTLYPNPDFWQDSVVRGPGDNMQLLRFHYNQYTRRVVA